MARPRTPTAVLKLRGAFEVNPARGVERANEPTTTDPVGPAPTYFDTVTADVWDELSAKGFWLTHSDTPLLEVACVLLARFRIGNSFEAKDVAVTINVLNKLGFSPAERSKIKAPGAKKEPSPFDRFTGKHQPSEVPAS